MCQLHNSRRERVWLVNFILLSFIACSSNKATQSKGIVTKDICGYSVDLPKNAKIAYLNSDSLGGQIRVSESTLINFHVGEMDTVFLNNIDFVDIDTVNGFYIKRYTIDSMRLQFCCIVNDTRYSVDFFNAVRSLGIEYCAKTKDISTFKSEVLPIFKSIKKGM